MPMIPVRTEVWLRQDLLSLLRSVDKASACICDHLDSHDVALFRAGFRAAIEAMAEGLDVGPLAPAPRVAHALRIIDGGQDGTKAE